MEVSRRLLFKVAGFIATTTGMTSLGLYAWAEPQIAKSDAKYQDHPNGIQRCEICLQFEPPNVSWCRATLIRTGGANSLPPRRTRNNSGETG